MFLLLYDTDSNGERRPNLVNALRIDYCRELLTPQGPRTLICLAGGKTDQSGEYIERKLWVLETATEIASMLHATILSEPSAPRRKRK